MRIQFIQLENIRSHVKSTVPFAKGFNCLVGGLGCGKSSILYAIDFALFGEPLGRSYDYLLREGVNSGKIMLQFVQDGKSYRISRGLKRRSQNINQDFDELQLLQDEDLVASGKADAVVEQLMAITSLDKELYREIVWVRQEHLKELLNARPRERQKRLDELFGLSNYEKAWGNLAGLQREYQTERRIYEKDSDVIGAEGLSSEYNDTAEEFTSLEIQLHGLAKKLQESEKALQCADLKLRRLEELRKQTEDLRRKETEIRSSISGAEDVLTSLAKRIERKRDAVKNFRQRADSMGEQLESCKTELENLKIPSDKPIEALKQHIAAFDDQITSLKGKQESILRSIQKNQKRHSSLSAENRCPLCLQPLATEYRGNLIQKIEDENAEFRNMMSQLQRDIVELTKTRSRADDALSKIQMLDPRIKECEHRLNDESQMMIELSRECDEKKKLANELRKRLQAIQAEIDEFDVSDLEAARVTRDDAFRHFYQLESDLRGKEDRKKDLAKRLDELKERINNAQEKIEHMEKISKIMEAISFIRDAYRSIQPRLRSEFVKVLRNFVQQVLDSLVGRDQPSMNVLIDETYTPCVRSESSVEREVSNLSGGERTLLAFAYRLGLGQLIMQSRTGRGLSLLLLDEPTESLGTEDSSVNRLADAVSRFKATEQIIAVTHSEDFAEKADHVVRLEKEGSVSRISLGNE